MVYLMIEWDIPKSRERRDDYWKYMRENMLPLNERMAKYETSHETVFGDNTGHIVRLIEFADIDAFGKYWSDLEFQRVFGGFAVYSDNLSYRFGRPPQMGRLLDE
jgi:hypothetical protein